MQADQPRPAGSIMFILKVLTSCPIIKKVPAGRVLRPDAGAARDLVQDADDSAIDDGFAIGRIVFSRLSSPDRRYFTLYIDMTI